MWLHRYFFPSSIAMASAFGAFTWGLLFLCFAFRITGKLRSTLHAELAAFAAESSELFPAGVPFCFFPVDSRCCLARICSSIFNISISQSSCSSRAADSLGDGLGDGSAVEWSLFWSWLILINVCFRPAITLSFVLDVESICGSLWWTRAADGSACGLAVQWSSFWSWLILINVCFRPSFNWSFLLDLVSPCWSRVLRLQEVNTKLLTVVRSFVRLHWAQRVLRVIHHLVYLMSLRWVMRKRVE